MTLHAAKPSALGLWTPETCKLRVLAPPARASPGRHRGRRVPRRCDAGKTAQDAANSVAVMTLLAEPKARHVDGQRGETRDGLREESCPVGPHSLSGFALVCAGRNVWRRAVAPPDGTCVEAIAAICDLSDPKWGRTHYRTRLTRPGSEPSLVAVRVRPPQARRRLRTWCCGSPGRPAAAGRDRPGRTARSAAVPARD
jgi:hypothetical protein